MISRLALWTAMQVTLALMAATACADYLEVRRATSIRSLAQSGSAPLLAVEPGDILMLERLAQTNGYYEVRLPNSTQTGFIYRTYGRGFRGDPPDFSQADIERFRERHLGLGKPEVYFERIREGYAVGYDARLKIPVWVQHTISPEDVIRTPSNQHVVRKDDFRSDITMPEYSWATNRDYGEPTAPGNEPYARGHLAPAADMIRSERVMSESFYLSNMVPQVGDEFNGSVWEDLERDLRSWVASNGPVTIIVGPVFRPSDNADRVITYRTIGDNRVAVPTHLFKIIIDNSDPQTPRTLAFLMENRPYADDESYEDALVSIDEIEQATGLDVLRNLNDNLELDAESDPADEIWWIDSN